MKESIAQEIVVKVIDQDFIYLMILKFEYRNSTKRQLRKKILKYIGTDV